MPLKSFSGIFALNQLFLCLLNYSKQFREEN